MTLPVAGPDCDVGRFYLVPCVEWELKGLETLWPVYGDFHADPGVFDPHDWDPEAGPAFHYHLDVRFLTKLQASRWSTTTEILSSIIYRRRRLTGGAWCDPVIPKPTLRRRRCARRWPVHPGALHGIGAEFEGGRQGVLPACGTCPHRGLKVPAATSPEGLRVCPGHGLAWTALRLPVDRPYSHTWRLSPDEAVLA